MWRSHQVLKFLTYLVEPNFGNKNLGLEKSLPNSFLVPKDFGFKKINYGGSFDTILLNKDYQVYKVNKNLVWYIFIL